MIAVTLAPTDFASDNPCETAFSASGEPSVGIRICRYMHCSLLAEPNRPCSGRPVPRREGARFALHWQRALRAPAAEKRDGPAVSLPRPKAEALWRSQG